MSIRLTVIIPFFNELTLIGEAVRSVRQDGEDGVEIIVVNDGPECTTGERLASAIGDESVRIIQHTKNRGLSAARNTALSAANGKYVGFLDADDVFLPGGLCGQLARAEETSADIVHALASIAPLGRPYRWANPREIVSLGARRILRGSALYSRGFSILSCWSSFYRRAFLAECGICFEENQRIFEDRPFVVNSLTAAGSLATLGVPVRIRRHRIGSITQTYFTPERTALRIAAARKTLIAWSGAPEDVREHLLARQYVFFLTAALCGHPAQSLIFLGDGEDANTTGERADLARTIRNVGLGEKHIEFIARRKVAPRALRIGRVQSEDLIDLHHTFAKKHLAAVLLPDSEPAYG